MLNYVIIMANDHNQMIYQVFNKINWKINPSKYIYSCEQTCLVVCRILEDFLRFFMVDRYYRSLGKSWKIFIEYNNLHEASTVYHIMRQVKGCFQTDEKF